MPLNFRLKWLDAHADRVAKRRSWARVQGLSDRMLKDIGVSRSSVGYPPDYKPRARW